jgi:hypothetical protein
MAKSKKKRNAKMKALNVRGGYASSAFRQAQRAFTKGRPPGRATTGSWTSAITAAGKSLASDIGRKVTDEAKQFAYETALNAADRVMDGVKTKTGELLENVKLPTRPGQAVGRMFPAITTNSERRSPINIGKNNSKVITTTFKYGKPSTRSIRDTIRNEGYAKLRIEDTRRSLSYLSDFQNKTGAITGNVKRERLTLKTGFNQRTYYTASVIQGINMGNVLTTYGLVNINNPGNFNPNLGQYGTVTEYGCASEHRNKISISSLNSYNQCTVRVSLLTIKKLEVSGRMVSDYHTPLQYFVGAGSQADPRLPFPDPTPTNSYPSNMVNTTDDSLQTLPSKRITKYVHIAPKYDEGDHSGVTVPYYGWNRYLLNTADETSVEDYAQCVVDPSSTWNNSPALMRSFDVVKTFTRKLNPGDTWNVNLIQSLGSGIDLTSMTTYLGRSRDNLYGVDDANFLPNFKTPLGYYVVIDIVGQPTIGFMKKGVSVSTDNTKKNEPIHGTSPSAVQIDVETYLTLATLNNNKGSSNNSNIKYATKMYQRDSDLQMATPTILYNTDYGSPDTDVWVETNTDSSLAGSIGGTLS